MGSGFIYLICENGDNQLYKIGVTKSDISTRLKKLQTGNGNPLYCVYSFKSDNPYKLEKMLHNHFSFGREEGEWFLLEKGDVDTFPELCRKYQTIIDSLKDNPFF
jgi:hypothetical protein